MDILHLSDLHVTEKNETLPTIWSHAESALADRLFDYVLISGDLTQQATHAEFQALAAFLNKSILPRLRSRERHRIVMVPGNHDVDWLARIADPWNLSKLRSPTELEELADRLQEHRKNPDRSKIRVHLGPYGHLEVLSLNSDCYSSRFANLQAFLDEFYGNETRSYKPFILHRPGKPLRQWSAHVFDQGDERVAFYGFNSCAANDAYWQGAWIDHQAILDAKDHADELGEDVLRVAIWHHGFTSERGKGDSLGLGDIGRLHAADFHIGFHGHIHDSEGDITDLLSDRFVRISTGSLGAGQTERQDNVGKQFSVVTLHATRATVDTYEQKGTAKQYSPREQQRYPLFPYERKPTLARAETHQRTWTVDDDGIATVDVEIKSLRDGPDLPLASLTPPYCSVVAHAVKLRDRIVRRLEPDVLDSGRFYLKMPHKEEEFCNWSYEVSNGLAINRAELNILPDRRLFYPNIITDEERTDWDVRHHVVRFDCNKMTLKLAFHQDASPDLGFSEAMGVVEQEVVDQSGAAKWVRVPLEENRCKLETDTRAITLSVNAPVLEYRYGIAYRPRARGKGLTPRALRFVEHLVAACHGEEGKIIIDALTSDTRKALAEILTGDRDWPHPLTPGGAWLGAIWKPDERCLVTCFGEFRPHSWGTRFAAGTGIAGHSFRTASPCGWDRRHHSKDVLYQQAPPGSDDLEWIVSVPLKLSWDGPAVGALGFTQFIPASTPPEWLERLVIFAGDQAKKDKAAEKFVWEVTYAATLSFWRILSKTLSGSDADYANTVANNFRAGATTPSRPRRKSKKK